MIEDSHLEPHELFEACFGADVKLGELQLLLGRLFFFRVFFDVVVSLCNLVLIHHVLTFLLDLVFNWLAGSLLRSILSLVVGVQERLHQLLAVEAAGTLALEEVIEVRL